MTENEAFRVLDENGWWLDLTRLPKERNLKQVWSAQVVTAPRDQDALQVVMGTGIGDTRSDAIVKAVESAMNPKKRKSRGRK